MNPPTSSSFLVTVLTSIGFSPVQGSERREKETPGEANSDEWTNSSSYVFGENLVEKVAKPADSAEEKDDPGW